EDANKPVDFTDVTTKDENGDDYPFSKKEETSKPVEITDTAGTGKGWEYHKEQYAQNRAAEEMKEIAVNAAVREGKRLGTDIHVVNTPEELKNVLGDGYADMDADEVNAFTMPDGEIYIYAPSMTDSRFAIRQVWHEVVAHKGVKALLPAEDRKQFFKNVYDTMTDYAKDRFSRYVFDTLGAKSRKELGYGSYDELVQDKQAFETFIAKHSQKIADEYVARVYAENGDFERGVFQRMVDWLTHWAHEKFGGKLGIDNFSEADIRYILGESKEKLANGEDIKPIGTGSFGEIYDQFKGKAKEAIAFLMKKKGGEALGALHHKDIGDIDLVWGKEGTAKSDGYGLSKIVKYHPEVLNNLQEILDDMEVNSRSDNRINLESEKYQASVRLTWDDQKKTWLLTAFKKKETSEPTNSRTDVDSNLNGKSDDTATRQSSDVSSDGKGTLSSTNNQGENPKNATFSTKEQDLDDEYLKAIKDGDMDKAQRMVNEAAERAGYNSSSDYQGTSAFNGAAPERNAYWETREERKQAYDNEEFEGDISLGDMRSGIDKENFLERLGSEYRLARRRMANKYDQYQVESAEAL
ncbi:MAG: hypothetical protein J6Y15_08595, partial [Bacteroidaceae bacterium]|nr:hypothetical protein [Bacteroidaceae bacterium]